MQPPLAILALTAAVGCGDAAKAGGGRSNGGADAGAPPQGPSAYDPSAYLDDEAAASTGADFDRDWAENTLAEVFLRIPELHAGPVLAAYRDGMTDADPDCPSRYEADGNAFWYASCESDAGTGFSGYAFDYLYEDAALYGDGNLWDAAVLSGAATITDGDARFELSGTAYVAESQQGDDLISTSDLAGWFEVIGDRWAGDDWMTTGLRPSVSLYAVTRSGAAPARYLSVSGAIGGLAPDVPGVDLEQVSFADAGAGYPCAAEPTGTISLRDASGAWWEVRFDVDPDSWRLDGACDGCGAVFFQGEQVGEACADPSPMLGWGGAPW